MKRREYALKAKRISPLLALIITSIIIGAGVIAYNFWTSTTFTETITTSAIFNAYANFDPSTLTNTLGTWHLDQLTINPDFSTGNTVYIIADKKHNLDGTAVYISVITGGEYVAESGVVDVSCQRMQATWNDVTNQLHTFDDPQGSPIVINDVATSTPVELPGLMSDLDSGTNGYTIHYYLLDFDFLTVMAWGDYDVTVQIVLTDGA